MPGSEPQRTCGTCSLCCKLMEVETLYKPAGTWCSKCSPPNGCSIHPQRPDECKAFTCGWLSIPGLIEDWRPQRSKIILYLTDKGDQLNVLVDPGSPTNWRQPVFYDQLKMWARQSARGGPDVLVHVGNRSIAILPDKDVDLGFVGPDDKVFIGRKMTAARPRFMARKIPAGDSSAESEGE